MVDKLNDKSPVSIDSRESTAYAQRDPRNGGVILYPSFFRNNPAGQAGTMAHESVHDTMHLAQDEGYGATFMNNYSKSHPLSEMLTMPDALTHALGLPRTDMQ